METGKTDQDYFIAMFHTAQSLAEGPFVVFIFVMFVVACIAAFRGL